MPLRLVVRHPLTLAPLPAGGALGIGFEISRAFALEGCHVVMVNRKEEQGDEAIAKITKEGEEKGKKVSVEWVGCDLGTLKQVQEVFSGLRKRLDRLDLVGGCAARAERGKLTQRLLPAHPERRHQREPVWARQ